MLNCAIADGSPGAAGSDSSPTSSSAPSPTDHSKLSSSGGGGAADDKRFPQPIGAGRTNKKPSATAVSQNMFQLGDPAANAGLWAFAAG